MAGVDQAGDATSQHGRPRFDTEDCPMDPDFRFDRFVADWLAPGLVVAAAMALGLALFATESRWWAALAGPVSGMVSMPERAPDPHR
jgi:hypothetical protein